MDAIERHRNALRQHLNDIPADDPHYQPIRRIIRDRLNRPNPTETAGN